MEAYKVDATINLVEDIVQKLVPSLREAVCLLSHPLS